MGEVIKDQPGVGDVIYRGGPFEGKTIRDQPYVEVIETQFDGEVALYRRTEGWEQLRGVGAVQPYRRWRVYEWAGTA